MRNAVRRSVGRLGGVINPRHGVLKDAINANAYRDLSS
jgi:hypothetical protein